MVQLRDAQTSELIAEGTPLEIATLAADLDATDVLFDDCGPVDGNGRSTFDPAAVRQARADELASLEATLDALPAKAPAETREALRATIKDRRDRIKAGKDKVAGAKTAMQDARQRVQQRAGR